jgi:hypothetical protein
MGLGFLFPISLFVVSVSVFLLFDFFLLQGQGVGSGVMQDSMI